MAILKLTTLCAACVIDHLDDFGNQFMSFFQIFLASSQSSIFLIYSNLIK